MLLPNTNGYKSDIPISGHYLKMCNFYKRSHSILQVTPVTNSLRTRPLHNMVKNTGDGQFSFDTAISGRNVMSDKDLTNVQET
jgi:hypothetical protein